MANGISLEEARANIGARVVYRPHAGTDEDGTITSVNEWYVFVRYMGDQHSKATRPDDLEFLGRPYMPGGR